MILFLSVALFRMPLLIICTTEKVTKKHKKKEKNNLTTYKSNLKILFTN